MCKKMSWTKLNVKIKKITRKRDKETDKIKLLCYWIQYRYWIRKWEKYFD